MKDLMLAKGKKGTCSEHELYNPYEHFKRHADNHFVRICIGQSLQRVTVSTPDIMQRLYYVHIMYAIYTFTVRLWFL